MKKLLSAVISVCAAAGLLASCGAASAPASGSASGDVAGYDQYIDLPGSIALTSDGYYFRNEELLYFLDASLGYPAGILCARADCTHEKEEECTARIPPGTLFSWNSDLYYIDHPDGDSGFVLFRMDAGGANRKRVAELDIDFGSGGSWYTRCACGYIVFCFSYSTAQRSTDITTLYLISMEDPGGTPAVLFSNGSANSPADAQWNEVPRPFPMYITWDDVFYLVEQFTDGELHTLLYRYQISTGETTLLAEDAVTGADRLSLEGDQLHWFDADGALYTISLTGGGIEKNAVIALKEQQYGACDDRWLYIAAGKPDAPEEAEVVIYDYQGGEVQRLSCGELGTSLSFAFSTPDKVFFRVSGLDYRASILPICYLEKSAIAEGTADFLTLDAARIP